MVGVIYVVNCLTLKLCGLSAYVAGKYPWVDICEI
jgi:hypothetical protein